MHSKIWKWFTRPAFFPVLLFGTALVSYGFYLFRMGFYWDDWQAIFIGRMGNPNLFWSYFTYDRPVSAWTHLLAYPLFGSNAALWQLFTITLRWLTSLGMWWALRGVWPQHTYEVSWMALLLLVFPGFTQQSISVAYSQHFITYALFTLSLGLTVWSLRRPRWFWHFTILAVLVSLLQLLTMEYFAGLELLRPILILFIVMEAGGNVRSHLARVMKVWWPYAAALAVFAVFRFVYYPRLSPDPGANAPVLLINWLQEPLTQTVRFIQIMLQDVVHLLVFSWVNPLQPALIDLTYKFWMFSWLVGIVSSAAAAGYLVNGLRRRSQAGGEKSRSFVYQAILLGLLGILLGGLPVWATDRQAIVGLWSDRFLLAPMFGAVVLVVALVTWLSSSRARGSVVLALLLAVSIAAQMRNVDEYRRSWVTQRNYFWQMAWRIPALEPGTILLSTSLPFKATSDYSMSFAINMIYAPDLTTTQMPYLYLNAPRYRSGLLRNYQEEQPVAYTARSVRFDGSTSQAVVIDKQEGNACVRVLLPGDTADPKLTRAEIELAVLSRPAQIIASPSSALLPPQEVFGPEPVHEWCYFYEKADLARQVGEWQQAVALYDEAQARGFHTKYGWELQPLIEASAMTGDWQRALNSTAEASRMTASMNPALCNVWKRIDQNAPISADKQAALASIRDQLQCRAK